MYPFKYFYVRKPLYNQYIAEVLREEKGLLREEKGLLREEKGLNKGRKRWY